MSIFFSDPLPFEYFVEHSFQNFRSLYAGLRIRALNKDRNLKLLHPQQALSLPHHLPDAAPLTVSGKLHSCWSVNGPFPCKQLSCSLHLYPGARFQGMGELQDEGLESLRGRLARPVVPGVGRV